VRGEPQRVVAIGDASRSGERPPEPAVERAIERVADARRAVVARKIVPVPGVLRLRVHGERVREPLGDRRLELERLPHDPALLSAVHGERARETRRFEEVTERAAEHVVRRDRRLRVHAEVVDDGRQTAPLDEQRVVAEKRHERLARPHRQDRDGVRELHRSRGRSGRRWRCGQYGRCRRVRHRGLTARFVSVKERDEREHERDRGALY